MTFSSYPPIKKIASRSKSTKVDYISKSNWKQKDIKNNSSSKVRKPQTTTTFKTAFSFQKFVNKSLFFVVGPKQVWVPKLTN